MKNIELIVEHDVCVSCGACSHICPFRNIQMEYSSVYEKWLPRVIDRKFCHQCNGLKNCLSVCQSFAVDYQQLAESHKNHLLGKVSGVYTGYSLDDELRFFSTSGGFVTSLCRDLLTDGMVDGVIALQHESGLEYVPKLFTKAQDCSMPGSIYHNVNYEQAFHLLKANDGKFAIVGLPCQLTSIALLCQKKQFIYLQERIYAKISLVCGYIFDRYIPKAFAEFNNFQLGEITYRGQSRFRRTEIRNTNSSKVFEAEKLRGLQEYINHRILVDKFFCQNYCLYCVDHLAYVADIVAGDARLQRYHSDTLGSNIIICRTSRGEELLSRLSNFCLEPGTLQDIVESQTELYAVGALGEHMRKRWRTQSFIPSHPRTTENSDIKIYPLPLVAKFKLLVIRDVFRQKKFTHARYLYLIARMAQFLNSALEVGVKKLYEYFHHRFMSAGK